MTRRNPTQTSRRHEDTPVGRVSSELQLRSLVKSQLNNNDVVSDVTAATIAELVPMTEPSKVAVLAIAAREQMKLTHLSLLLVREMARHRAHRGLVSETLARVIQTPDELSEFAAIYWKDGRVPLSSQVKKGLALAFQKFDEQQLASCDRHKRIKLRDVLFLSHAKPRDEAQAATWKRLIWGRLSVSNPKDPKFRRIADNGKS
jgi:hypothetical protein